MFASTALKSAIVITSFVAVMMLIVEYLNVRTRGVWIRLLGESRRTQYLLAVTLGATPGCLGAYVVVALYTHRRMTLGALTAAMIATSGGEALVMLALFPRTAMLVTAGLMALGVIVAYLTDVFLNARSRHASPGCDSLVIHEDAPWPAFSKDDFITQWKSVTAHRAVLALLLTLVALGVVSGELGPSRWSWMKIAFLVATLVSWLIVVTVHDHFLDGHLWQHIAKKHVPTIFLWTLGVLLLLGALERYFDLAAVITENPWCVLLVAALVGVAPESGPHLVFVSLYHQATLPLSILVTSCIVQDGHGMLPLLATSRRDFLVVKSINIAAGLLVGGALLAAGH